LPAASEASAAVVLPAVVGFLVEGAVVSSGSVVVVVGVSVVVVAGGV